MKTRKQAIESGLHIINKKSQQVPFTQNYVQNKLDEVREKLKREGRPVWILVLKARQEGCSAKIEADWLVDCASQKNINAVVISHEKESTKRLLRRVHYYIETAKYEIPTKVQSEYEISFPETNSWFYIGTAGSRAFGRGDTIHRVHFSEWAFYQDDSVVDGILQSIPEGGEVVAESTANGFGNRFQIEWDRATKGESKFFPLFFSWADNPEYSIPKTILTEEDVTEEEKVLRDAYRLTIPQLAWRREKMKEFDTREKFMQEYPLTPEEAFIYTGTPAFNQIALKSYIKKPPAIGMFVDSGTEVVFEPKERGWWRRWETSEAGMDYYGFLDPAEGKDPVAKKSPGSSDPDYAVIEIYDHNLKQCAELQQRITPAEAGRQLALAARYYNQAFVGWELNNSGHAVSVVMPEVYHDGKLYRQENGELGWRTTEKTRKVLIDGLAEMIPEHDIEIQSEWSVAEAMAFRLNPDGKYEAQQGSHDDTVIANAGIIQMFKSRPLKQMTAVKKWVKDNKKAKKKGYANRDAD